MTTGFSGVLGSGGMIDSGIIDLLTILLSFFPCMDRRCLDTFHAGRLTEHLVETVIALSWFAIKRCGVLATIFLVFVFCNLLILGAGLATNGLEGIWATCSQSLMMIFFSFQRFWAVAKGNPRPSGTLRSLLLLCILCKNETLSFKLNEFLRTSVEVILLIVVGFLVFPMIVR